MIDVVKLINTFEDLIYHFIDSDMYCICYDDGKDKRLMINYGLFLTEEDCLNYIDSINNSNLIAYNIKMNVCENNHSWIGESNCPHCGKPIADQYTRVVGFLTSVNS